MANLKEVADAVDFVNKATGASMKHVPAMQLKCDSFTDFGEREMACKKWNYTFYMEKIPTGDLKEQLFGQVKGRVRDFKRDMPETGVTPDEQQLRDAFARIIAGSQCIDDVRVVTTKTGMELVIPLHYTPATRTFTI